MIVRDVLGFKRSKCFPIPAHPQRLSAVVNECERTGFAQHRWEGPILDLSHCLCSLPCVSCYMGSKCQFRDVPENPYRYPKAHKFQLAQASSSYHLHLLPLPSSGTRGGSRWCAPHGGEDSRALVLLSMLCVSCWCYLGVSLFSLCSVHSPRVPGSGCESGRCEEVGCALSLAHRPRLPRCSTNTPCLPCCLPSAPQELLPPSSRSQSLQNRGIKTLGYFTAKFLCSTPHQNTPFG